MKTATANTPQDIVDAWNAKNPQGTKVIRYKYTNPLREGKSTVTTSTAFVYGGHTPAIMVEGVPGSVSLNSVVIDDREDTEIEFDPMVRLPDEGVFVAIETTNGRKCRAEFHEGRNVWLDEYSEPVFDVISWKHI